MSRMREGAARLLLETSRSPPAIRSALMSSVIATETSEASAARVVSTSRPHATAANAASTTT